MWAFLNSFITKKATFECNKMKLQFGKRGKLKITCQIYGTISHGNTDK